MTAPATPSEADEARADAQIRLTFAAVPFAVCLGTGIITAALWGVRTLLQDAPQTDAPNLGGPAALVLLVGTFLGVVLAAVAAWTILAPVDSWFRRGGLAAVSAFGALAASAAAVPAWHLLGRTGLLLLAACCAAGCVVFGRAVSRRSVTR